MLRGFSKLKKIQWRRRGFNLPLTASLPPLWTFSRASQGTQVQSGVLSYAPNNILFPSVNFYSNSAPSGSVDGITQNAGVAPDGSSTATALIPGTFNSGTHQYYGTFSGAVGTTYTHSKKNLRAEYLEIVKNRILVQ